MKKYLLSAFFVMSALTFSAQAVTVSTIGGFSSGDLFEAQASTSGIGLTYLDDGVDAGLADSGETTIGAFEHDYVFSAVSGDIFSISAAVSNSPAIPGLMMTLYNLTTNTIIGGPTAVTETSVSLNLTMLDTNSYRIRLVGTGSLKDLSDYTLDVKVVPIPAAFLLFGTALMGLFGFQRNKNKSLAAAV